VADSAETRQQLFAKCSERERQLKDRQQWEQLKLNVIQSLAFRPVFITAPASGGAPAHSKSVRAKLAKLGEDALQGARYRDLLELLKKCSDNEARLYVLSCWLEQEQVCQPRDFLPRELFQKFTQEAHDRAKVISPADWYYFALVEAWRPYFEQLTRELREIRTSRRVRETLISYGYEAEAIALMYQKRKLSVTGPICAWLERRRIGKARTIEVAYSRIRKFLTSQ